MDNKNRPHAREKNVVSGGKGVQRRGSAGTGRVGSGNAAGGRKSGAGGASRAAAGGGGGIALIILFYLLFGGQGSAPADNSGYSDSGSHYEQNTAQHAVTEALDTSVASGSRDKRTKILGNGKDAATIMVYMCGTDLESKYGMASSDMEEMRAASKDFGDNMNLIVYTGGCKEWKSGVSSKTNQIYGIKDGKISLIESDIGNKTMTDPDTLSEFIRYCAKNYPANRNELILWDHGGGSVSGYGYDEKKSSAGSMKLAGISKALRDGGTVFDFVGFDACLMATAENALMLNEFADYLIASEETEPGIGWYYTNWLSSFAKNTSMPTAEIGKNIIDDFITECDRKCRGQKTTLSIIDLAEFANTVPADLSAFSRSVSDMISSDGYKTVSDARYAAREFAPSSKIDQVDLCDLAERMNTAEGRALSASIKGAVKYNRTSYNMTNANGVSIFFPYKKASYVDPACNTYEQIGMDPEYSECIRKFAKIETSGQISAGGNASPIGSLFGIDDTYFSDATADVIGGLLQSFLSGGRSLDGLDGSNTAFMDSVDDEKAAEYISNNYFDASNLFWEKDGDTYKMTLPETQWELVHSIDKAMFYYDGEGYVDLGLDNLFSFDESGNLIADTDKDWVSVNGQIAAYYHTDSIENADGSFTDMGYVPAKLNGVRAELIIVFENGGGRIAGASFDYHGGETETVSKNITEINEGDTIELLCDFYSDSLEYQDTYYLGDPITYTENITVNNTVTGEGNVKILYRFTDIYNREYWSEIK